MLSNLLVLLETCKQKVNINTVNTVEYKQIKKQNSLYLYIKKKKQNWVTNAKTTNFLQRAVHEGQMDQICLRFQLK